MNLSSVITIKQSDACKSIIEKLQSAGYQAYMVGGCVRDGYLGQPPHDEDITTSATPEQVKKLFNTYDTGIQHGTVTTVINAIGYEITTFRIDGDYSDGRHPDSVKFAKTIEEDLGRRDFTINAMAYNDVDGLVDPYDGYDDLINNKVIRCVGNPNQRFQEDALRMMRAIRFSAKLGFIIEQETKWAIQYNAKLIQNVSKERIHDEIEKILLSPHPEYFALLYEYGLLKYISKDLNEMFQCKQNNPYHFADVGYHSMEVLKHLVGQSKCLLWAGLFHDIGKPVVKETVDGVDHFYGHSEKSVEIADRCMKDLRFDNQTKNYVLRLVRDHDRLGELYKSKHPKKHIRNFVMDNQDMSNEYFNDICILKYADASAHQQNSELLYNCDVVKEYLEPYAYGVVPRTKMDLAVNGKDILEFSIDKRLIGKVQDKLLMHVLDNPKENTKERLIGLISGCIKSVEKEEKQKV